MYACVLTFSCRWRRGGGAVPASSRGSPRCRRALCGSVEPVVASAGVEVSCDRTVRLPLELTDILLCFACEFPFECQLLYKRS